MYSLEDKKALYSEDGNLLDCKHPTNANYSNFSDLRMTYKVFSLL